ncbi:alpha/beta hydrolase [Phenylobacterium sp.]|uniref:alpha/beta hydrolase n=1 Tax=Phenylobacterium sp. TaxID=1871053 RepID=UPI003FA78924
MTPVSKLLLAAFAVLTLGAASPAGPHTQQFPIWPGAAPGGEHATAKEEVIERRKSPDALRDRIVRGVVTPTLVVFRPDRPNGSAILMAPGGGYEWVVMDKEGYEAAELFAARGVTVFVMSYRLPHEGWAAGPDVALQDSQRALRLIRGRAAEFGIDPRRLGVMGFSAGGHVAGELTLAWDKPVYVPVDATDTLSARPDFSVLMYPVGTMKPPFVHARSRKSLLGGSPSAQQLAAYSLEDQARPDAPPVLIVHAADDDSVPVENALALFDALRAKKVPAELHVFEEGGHGFGLRFAVGKPVAAWPEITLKWMERRGFMSAAR